MYTFGLLMAMSSVAAALPERQRAVELQALYLSGDIERLWPETSERWRSNICPRGEDDCDLHWLGDLLGGDPVDAGDWTCPVTGGGTYHRGHCRWNQDHAYPDGQVRTLHTWVTPDGQLDELSWSTVLEPGGVKPKGLLPGWYVPAWLGASVLSVVGLGALVLASRPRSAALP